MVSSSLGGGCHARLGSRASTRQHGFIGSWPTGDPRSSTSLVSLLMASQRPKRFRVTARDNNGDILAFESDNRDRAKERYAQVQRREELHDVQMETQRWI